ncbi:hypothetical protein FB451DRAFT_1284923 [Mycena latifolia]|nr:hypothetical protein FB451DRAFT_1284923 [Mycena latifolia]
MNRTAFMILSSLLAVLRMMVFSPIFGNQHSSSSNNPLQSILGVLNEDSSAQEKVIRRALIITLNNTRLDVLELDDYSYTSSNGSTESSL